MAKITNVDYTAIPNHARQMRTLGQELNKELTTAYQSVGNMHNCWYGKRYNELAKEFNKIIPTINELLDLVVGQIPYTLETIANNYSQVDQGTNITSASQTAPNKITEVSMPNDVGMRFETTEVQTIKTNISNNFKNSKEKMNAIETEYKKVNWKSDASEAFTVKFTKLKTDIITAFDNIESSFAKLMQQTLDDMQATESANTVK